MGSTIWIIAKYKGKKILIVNTASKCGFTPQYADLEKLYVKYQDKLVIIGFPANNFGQQELRHRMQRDRRILHRRTMA